MEFEQGVKRSETTEFKSRRVDRFRVSSGSAIGFGISPTLVPIVENVFGRGIGGPASTFYLFFMAFGFVLAVFASVALLLSTRYPMKTDAAIVGVGEFIGQTLSNRSF